MPHITVKLYSGRSDAEKRALSDRLTQAVAETLGYGAQSVSVAIEDVEPSERMERVYEPDIASADKRLFKRPGYGPLAS